MGREQTADDPHICFAVDDPSNPGFGLMGLCGVLEQDGEQLITLAVEAVNCPRCIRKIQDNPGLKFRLNRPTV